MYFSVSWRRRALTRCTARVALRLESTRQHWFRSHESSGCFGPGQRFTEGDSQSHPVKSEGARPRTEGGTRGRCLHTRFSGARGEHNCPLNTDCIPMGKSTNLGLLQDVHDVADKFWPGYLFVEAVKTEAQSAPNIEKRLGTEVEKALAA
ncbi:hypothetical protein NDU88_006986 [Pleurodeles waltl]|uniref:Uncharacterized protein n=1 Tax=Pleurodeles waltl TaxID=8319 RepID=A0AAV7N0U7_PLEWA|nr:hypothetical protein NDU88_006986 [Pleurodeles waltl]